MKKVADFGQANTGLVGTLGYELFDAAGASTGARTTAGIAELGSSGIYVADIQKTFDDDFILWDTGGGTPIFAVEELTMDENNILLGSTRNEMNQGGTPRRTFYEDDNTTVYAEGDAFEDQAGATPYAGNGVERIDGLS